MVSTRSRSSLRSGDAEARAADAGQPEVSSTPRRSSRRTGKAAEPASTSGRANQGRPARKATNLDAIEEAEEPLPSPQPQQVAAVPPQQAGSASPSKHPPTTRRAAAAAARPASSHGEAAEQERQQQQRQQEEGSQQPGADSQRAEEEEEEQEGGAGEAPSSQPAAMELSSLAADAGLLDKVASEMFAALEEAFGGGGAAGSGSGSEEQESGSEAEADMEEEEEGAHGGADIAGAKGDGVPRHLRWEPELQLPDSSGKAAGRQQQRKGLKAAREEPLAKQMHVAPRDECALQRSRRGTAPDTAGKQWFDLPATTITDEVKRDLRMLRLRSAFDPKSFYKKFDTTKFPKHFQIGTVVESAADFYSGRLTNKERKRTFTEEVMADPHLAEVRKKRFTKLQEEKSYWSKKKVARKTENERLKKKPRKPKH